MNQLKATLITLLLVVFFISLKAVPALRHPIEVSQPDGSILTIIPYGDEHFHWVTSTDGYTLIKNAKGVYEYAIQAKDLSLVTSGIKATDIDERLTVEKNFVQSIEKDLRFSSQQVSSNLMLKSTQKSTAASNSDFPTTGERNLIMILATFSDTTPTYTQQNFDDFMNKDGGVSGTGSFHDYYMEVSYGQLDITTTVTVWVTVPNNHDYYGPEDKWTEFAYDAIVAANNAGVDFSQFDNDGDGIVDGIAIIHQGQGQEYTSDETDIWSHSYSIGYGGYSIAQRTFDGVLVNPYTIQPEEGDLGEITTIGVMCHEFGHNLGAPDYYDTDYEESGGEYDGAGQWDIMSSGAWNGSPYGSVPAHHNMYQKIQYGWLTPVEINVSDTFTLLPAEGNTEAYLINTTTENEFFILENRQQTGFDADLPGHGLIIYHIDEDYINSHFNTNDINVSSHQGLYVKAANGMINSSGAPFPGVADVSSFTDNTNPGSLSWSNENTGKPITNITETDTVISFYIDAYVMDPPTWLTCESGSDQIQLNWSLNDKADSVLLVYGPGEIFSNPDTILYEPGTELSNGDIVLYVGTDTTFTHSLLSSGNYYSYKIYSFSAHRYSSGVVNKLSTDCLSDVDITYTENFEKYPATIPGICWETKYNTTKNGGLNGSLLQSVNYEDGDETWHVISKGSSTTNNYIANGEKSIFISKEAANYQWLISQEIALPDTGYVDLYFNVYYLSYGDYGLISNLFYVSIYSNNVWTTLLDWEQGDSNLYAEPVKIALDDYLGMNIKLAFIYKGNNSYNVAIDDIAFLAGETRTTINTNYNECIVIYPNPTSQQLYIEGNLAGAIGEIFNLQGKLVLSQKLSNGTASLDLHTFEPGIYFVKIESEKGTISRKIVIQ